MNLCILIDCCVILFYFYFFHFFCGPRVDYREILSFTLNKQSFIINHYHYLLLLSLLSSSLLLLLLLLFLRMCAGASQLHLVCLLLEAIRIGHYL